MTAGAALLERPDEALTDPVSPGVTADVGEETRAGLDPTIVAISALLATAAAAWLAGGMFRGAWIPRAYAFGGAALAVFLAAVSHRVRRPAPLQYLILPIAVVAGAIAVAPAATGGAANLPGLVGEALRGGGLLAPPVAFDPGWRFLLIVVFAVVGAAAATLPVAMDKPSLAVLLPVPIVVGAAVLQPPGQELVASTVAVGLLLMALTISYGSTLRTLGATDRRYERRRLLRSLVMVGVLLVAMVGLARTDVLFPAVADDQVIPPRLPPQVPLEPDRELFRVTGADAPRPWRVGALDVYDGESWMLPPIDRARIQPMTGSQVPNPSEAPGAGEVRFAIEVVDLSGRTLPVPAGLRQIEHTAGTLDFDPRLGVPELEQRVPRGMTYEVVAATSPGRGQLNASGPALPETRRQFTDAPPAPTAVLDLLAHPELPIEEFDRLQWLRDRLYEPLVAAGEGAPVPVPPQRVAQMLEGADVEATPFEIIAAEALLARWAGYPARIGYGYYGGDEVEGAFSLRPMHGAAWLEVHFDGFGWVPLLGTPPRAKANLDSSVTSENPMVMPSDELAMTVLVPVRRSTALMVFTIIRYWLLVLLPVITGIGALVVGYPAMCKAVRSSRRRRWARACGVPGRIVVAYAEFRDRCQDLNLGDSAATPLEFLSAFVDDAEHHELAWAYTRSVWGDLRRDLRVEDAEAVERLSRSVLLRVERMQTGTNRFAGHVSRTSLREPWDPSIPNVWPRIDVRRVGRVLQGVLLWPLRGLRRVGRVLRRPLRLQPTTTLAILLLLSTGCATQGGFTGASAPAALPASFTPDAPGNLLGLELALEGGADRSYVEIERSLAVGGRIFTLRDGSTVEGSLQFAVLDPELDASDRDVQKRIMAGLGPGWGSHQLGTVRLVQRELPQQVQYLWFPPERNLMVLLVMRSEFERHADVAEALVLTMRGIDPARLGLRDDRPSVEGGATTRSATREGDR